MATLVFSSMIEVTIRVEISSSRNIKQNSRRSREDYRIEKLVVVAAATPKVIMRSIAQEVTKEACQNTAQYVKESSKNLWSQSASITFVIHVLFGITLQMAIALYVVQTLKGLLMQHLI